MNLHAITNERADVITAVEGSLKFNGVPTLEFKKSIRYLKMKGTETFTACK